MPSGRIAKLNWTPSFGQYTVTINKKLYRLGTDKAEAEKQFRFLQTKTDMAEEITAVPTFGEVADGTRVGWTKRQYWIRQANQWKIFFEGVI